MYKVIQQAYFPKDRDIIREMWVSGDLKDRLGIAHRKARKRRGTKSYTDQKGSSDLEMVSIYESAHVRSASELSGWEAEGSPRGDYIPTGTETPNNGTPRRREQDERYLSPDTVPIDERNRFLAVTTSDASSSEGTRTPLPRYSAPISPAKM